MSEATYIAENLREAEAHAAAVRFCIAEAEYKITMLQDWRAQLAVTEADVNAEIAHYKRMMEGNA